VKEMRKMLVVLLIIGFLMLGAISIATEEPDVSFQDIDFSRKGFGDDSDDPAPCGGGNGNGGGAPG
jgi:hypothetical protein